MTIEPMWLGIGSAVLAAVLTFFMPVQVHRLNQTFIAIIIVVLVFIAAFSLFDFPLSLIVSIGASVAAIIFRDVLRFVRHAVYGVTKYTRRDYWYRRVGQTLIGRRGRR